VKNEPERIPLAKASDDGVETEVSRLMALAKQGDRAAFDQLAVRLRGRAFHTALALVGSREDALEQAQEAFLKTWRARDTFRDGEPFLPWFHRILRNTCFSFLRKRKRIRVHSMTVTIEGEETDWEIADDQPAPGARLEHDEARQAFQRAFRRLSSRDREILSLRHFQDLAYREIALALDVPEGTVMSRLFHARRRLRDLLAPHLENALKDYAHPGSADSPVGGQKERKA